jgi:hypothetical protein
MKEAEKLKEQKKNAKLAKMQADEEMRALFGEALSAGKNDKLGKNKKDAAKDQAASLKKEESDKSKLMKDYPFIADEMLASTGMFVCAGVLRVLLDPFTLLIFFFQVCLSSPHQCPVTNKHRNVE